MSDGALAAVLRLAARVDPSPADDDRLAAAAAGLSDWGELPREAEAHGLAPLLYAHLLRVRVVLSVETRQALAALALRHGQANRVRFQVLAEILDAFEQATIPVLVLKGAALAHLLYPRPGLRPLSDLDLLVAPQLAAGAQSVLAGLGFNAPVSPRGRALVGHHHLPAATKFVDGEIVHVEIHIDALSRDSGASLSMDRLSGPPQPFVVEGRRALAFGHADMLCHLTRHVAECAPRLRLVWVADLVGYATRFRETIPWPEVRVRYPEVTNALSLLHLVTALPDPLREYVRPSRLEGLRGIGVSCKPLSEIVVRNRSVGAIAKDLFDPSDWWLRLYYGLGDDSSLWFHRWVAHPLRVLRWSSRRVGSALRWRVDGAR